MSRLLVNLSVGLRFIGIAYRQLTIYSSSEQLLRVWENEQWLPNHSWVYLK